MEFVRGTTHLSRYPSPIVALGNFDGVHLGHHVLIRSVVARAREVRGTSIVVTFEPHPLRVLAPEKAPPLLTSLKTRLRILEDLGVDVVVVIPFTREFGQKGPEEFVREVLGERIGAQEVVVGQNYAFGRGRSGRVPQLIALGRKLGFTVHVVNPVQVEGVVVSSSQIRKYLQAGDVERAARMLGREYLVEGVVVPGHQRGASMGYPTANLSGIVEMLPRPGVYAVRATCNQEILDGVAYVGSQPTFHGEEIGLEVHLLRYSGNLYEKTLRVYFVAWLRPERTFPNQEALARQIQQDLAQAETLLHPPPPQEVGESTP